MPPDPRSLHAAEDALQAAALAGDADGLEALLHPRAISSGPDGALHGVEEELAPYRRGTRVIRRFDEVDRQARVVGTTGVTLVVAELEGLADRRPFAVRLRISRAWVHDDGRWRVLSVHRSRAPTPAAVVRDEGSGPVEDEPFDGDGEAFVLI